MALLLDIFGFLTVILRGLSISAQAFTLGGIAFVLFGLATSYLFCAAGAVLMAISLKSWIGGMVNAE